MIYLLIPLLILIGIFAFLQTERFGKRPTGERLKRNQHAFNYSEKKFQNSSPTPDFTDGATIGSVMKEILFQKNKRNKPTDVLPSVKVDLHALSPDQDCLVWFGHSSYFLQTDGVKFLVDPVLNGTASPIASSTRSFKGSDVYTVNDIPDIDYLVISHDHWDHLDYKTVRALQPRIGNVICPLGVGEHLELWGFKPAQLLEHNWHETAQLKAGFEVHFTPARHFSGRGLRRQTALWTSFVLQTPTRRIFLGGDSGYDTHFKEIGTKYGPFDLAVLECGQYNKSWKHIHMMPEEVVQAALDLNARVLLPVHWAKFSLSMHAWDEPIMRVKAESEKRNLALIHPMIGEPVLLNQTQSFSSWWLKVS